MDGLPKALVNKVLILLASGFEERSTISLLDRLRESGIATMLVSLTAGLVDGRNGLAIRPDASLEQVMETGTYQLVIVPGGRECASALVMDPRVHQLIGCTLQHRGYVAATTSAENTLFEVGIPSPADNPNFIAQSNLDTDAFAARLLNLLMA